MERLRIQYAKTEPLRYTGNLDMQKAWERTLRRSHLPMAYSQGFHPQPRLVQACPLPLGVISVTELVDVWLDEDISLDIIEPALIKALPPGIEIIQLSLTGLQEAALPTQVIASDYLAILLESISACELENRIQRLLEMSQIPRERHGKTYDLRPLVEQLMSIPEKDGYIAVFMRLSAREGATGRPEEVLAALNLDPMAARIQRTSLILKNN
ncbi:MAG TPA: TIGR03936 family radical SAM-associated protein [Anaerolineaceae bacterium]|nr:TIGR03936 family radical SAM-associated protein [Anaerolineaceae bacterium]